METATHIRLTATEMGILWSTYMEDTMSQCVLSYFLHTVEDPEIKPVIAYALEISQGHIAELKKLFTAEHFPIPHGFTDQDVNLHAQKLFADSFFLYYIKNMAKIGLGTYSLAYSAASRADIRTFYRESLYATEKLDQRVTQVLQTKGLYIRPPFIPAPEKIDFITDVKFLSGGFLGLIEKRALTAIEIAHLFMNAQTNSLGKTLLLGFNQVAQSPDIRHYLTIGIEIANKHLTIFSDLLHDEHLPVPLTWDGDVSASLDPPFSDKLILYHISILVAAGAANYGMAAAASPRNDVSADYVRLATEVASYAKAGAKLMIQYGWLEEPPQAVNREELTRT